MREVGDDHEGLNDATHAVTEATIRADAGLSVRRRRKPPYKPRRGMLPVVSVPEATLERLIGISEELDREYAKAEPDAARIEQLRLEGARIQAHPQPIIGDAPVRCIPPPTAETVLAAYLLWNGTKVPDTMREPNARRCLLALFEAAMGVPIKAAWAVPYAQEIHRAAVENLNERRREHLDEDTRKKFRVPQDRAAQARAVIDATAKCVGSWPVRVALPSWLTAELTRYLIGRYGFESGGGPGRLISCKRVLALLGSPSKLAHELKRSPQGATRWNRTIDAILLDVQSTYP